MAQRKLSARVLWIGALLASLGRAAYSADAPMLSFCRPPFVHPLIIKDLLTWLSDGGDQVVAINLLDTNDSNRYYGKIETEKPGKLAPRHPQVLTRVERTEGTEKVTETIGYEYVGLTRSGVHVLSTWESGGGTMVASNLLFVTIEDDFGINDVPTGTEAKSRTLRLDRRRLLIRKLGEVVLGDRWEGTLRVEGNKILVGRDQGHFNERGVPYNSKSFVLQLKDSATRPGVLRPCP
jgi:hypothetical protein